MSCRFKAEWKRNPYFKEWLEEVKDDTREAYRRLCRKTFDIENMGMSALKTHKRGKEHKTVSAQAASTEQP